MSDSSIIIGVLKWTTKQCFPQVGLLDREILLHLKVARQCTEVSEVGRDYVINYEYSLCTFRLRENTATNKHEIYAPLRSLMDSCWVLMDSYWVLVDSCWVLVDSYWVLVDSCWVLVDSYWVLVDSCWVLMDSYWVLVDSCWVLVDTTVEQIVCISIQNTDIIVYKFKCTFSFAFHTVCGRSVVREGGLPIL